MQIYKGIHIASAAPDKDEMQGIPHHLLEFLEMTKSKLLALSRAEFLSASEAHFALEEIYSAEMDFRKNDELLERTLENTQQIQVGSVFYITIFIKFQYISVHYKVPSISHFT